MAKIKNASKRNAFAVFEDPRPSFNTIYIEETGHNKTSLAPNFDLSLPTDATVGRVGQLGRNNTSDTWASAGKPGNCLSLTKQTTHVVHTADPDDSSQANVDYSWGISMDPDNPYTQTHYFTEGDQHQIIFQSSMAYQQTLIAWNNVQNDKELGDIIPSFSRDQPRDWSARESRYFLYSVLYHDPITDYISGLSYRIMGASTNTKSAFDPRFGLARLSQFPTTSGSYDIGTNRFHYIPQFIGPSQLDGKPIYIFNYRGNDYTQLIIKQNMADNNETTLHTFSATPSAAGSNYGGARDKLSGLMEQVKLASQTFDDPSSSGNKGFYLPYFDTSNNYFPFFVQWNTSDDTFTRNEDVTVTGDLSSSHLLDLQGIRTTYTNSGTGSFGGMKSVLYNETFVSSGNRYLTLIPIEGAYQANDSSDKARTIVTYSVNAADPKALTHHSTVIVPFTIRNIVWLNDARTQIGVICENSFFIYTFDNTNGWVLTATLPYQYWAVGRDSSDRIWAAAESSVGYTDIHLITSTVPISIVIEPASETYDYQGTTISSTVAVSAFGLDGTRIAIDVDLEIEGTTMTFGDDTTSTTVSTSATAAVDQAIKITGSGFNDITARVSF